MFGVFKRKPVYPVYVERPYLDDPVARMALQQTRGLPMTSWAGGTGQAVLRSMNALNPAYYIPGNSLVISDPYGRGNQPNYTRTEQPLTQEPEKLKPGSPF